MVFAALDIYMASVTVLLLVTFNALTALLNTVSFSSQTNVNNSVLTIISFEKLHNQFNRLINSDVFRDTQQTPLSELGLKDNGQASSFFLLISTCNWEQFSFHFLSLLLFCFALESIGKFRNFRQASVLN